MISETPCSATSVKPSGTRNLTGQRSRPPALPDISLMLHDCMKKGQENHAITSIEGTRKTAVPTRSSHSLPRSERCVYRMSTRTCSFTLSVYEAPNITIAAKRYHCTSSHAFDERSNA